MQRVLCAAIEAAQGRVAARSVQTAIESMKHPDPITALVRYGILERVEHDVGLSRKWRAAFVRASQHLYTAGDPGDDLRVPIVRALLEFDVTDDEDELAEWVATLLPLQARSLGIVTGPPSS